ncbi:LOW QUALITY PROTEIN: Protein EFR3 [Paramyrothecium foliicola]|nr:LOW QUALITY PROTEIN: Protein EFR3 [Paramyrothecium foliicola]
MNVRRRQGPFCWDDPQGGVEVRGRCASSGPDWRYLVAPGPAKPWYLYLYLSLGTSNQAPKRQVSCFHIFSLRPSSAFLYPALHCLDPARPPPRAIASRHSPFSPPAFEGEPLRLAARPSPIMNAIQQKCRPKHQVLVLKCYPRTTKGAVDVKPNSSELSYLLFYATSRKSKIQKIGAFLEKKTATDVWRMRIGNVQVTLGILRALLDKLGKDFALIAPNVLKILDSILRSNDITMVESSLPTFEAFCEHHEASSLFADQTYVRQYESIIRSYADLASTRKSPPSKTAISRPVQMRWRNAGLEAIKSVATSDALASLIGRQIDVIMPVILENLWTDNDDFLELLLQRIQVEEKVDSEKLLRRRTSVGTVATADTAGEPNPVELLGTALDVDKQAQEDTAVLAMQCLKSVFIIPNRPQIHAAASALFRFIFERLGQGESVVGSSKNNKCDSGWAIKILSYVTRWAPVQDRYVILVVTLDHLTRLPVQAEGLEQHLTLSALIGSLLRSDVNLVGLSIMDVLLGLVKQIKKLIQLSTGENRNGTLIQEKAETEPEGSAVPQRMELMARLEQCVSDLATHVYYADQISDMIAAILVRLKPSRSPSALSTPQGEKLDGNEGGPNASTADLNDNPAQNEVYLTYHAGRASALRLVKGILLVASPKTKITGNMDLSRNRVPIHVWEGTQWLLRDPDGHVRKAYVDALLTWLDRETTPADAMAKTEQSPQRSSVRGPRELQASTARRVVSGASNRDRSQRGRRAQFLPLLHLTIYDNALQYVDNDSDMVILHLLLTKLVFKLGVNAVRYGVPMIYRLQEDVLEVEQPIHKVRIAALCHGYFWALTEGFDFDGSVVGRAIHNEIVRRRNKGFWIDGIQVPAPLIDAVGIPGQTQSQPDWDNSTLEREEILPFDDRATLVECIETGYRARQRSPPGSPAVSPGRAMSGPMLGSTLSHAPTMPDDELPNNLKEQMLGDWSRETAIAALAAEGKTDSLSGSRNGTAGLNVNRLTVHSTGANGSSPVPGSPHGSHYNLRPHSFHVQGEKDRLGTAKQRHGSVRSGISPSASVPRGKAPVASVEQLKMVLSGNAAPQAPALGGDDDDSGDSMISYEYPPSEISFMPPPRTGTEPGTASEVPRRSLSSSRRGPLSSNPPHESRPVHEDEDGADSDEVPPVPPLPNLDSLPSKIGTQAGDVSVQDYAAKPARSSSSRRGRSSLKAMSLRSREDSGRGVDLQELLKGIDSHSGEGPLGNLTKPPY